MYELFEHTADLGLRVSGATLEDLMAEAAQGLLAMLVANPRDVRPLQEKVIKVRASEPGFLLFDWLNELLYVFESERLLLSAFDLRVGSPGAGTSLELIAHCQGEPMDDSRHQMDHEVKAITYHGLEVEKSAEGWRAQVIVDI